MLRGISTLYEAGLIFPLIPTTSNTKGLERKMLRRETSLLPRAKTNSVTMLTIQIFVYENQTEQTCLITFFVGSVTFFYLNLMTARRNTVSLSSPELTQLCRWLAWQPYITPMCVPNVILSPDLPSSNTFTSR